MVMPMRYEILNETGEVINRIVAGLDFVETHYPGRYRELADLIAQPAAVPQIVTPFQAKAALLLQGLLGDVEALVSDPATDPLVKLAWTTALEFRRTSPAILGIAQAMGWTEAQLDDLFTLAAGIEA